MVEFVLLNLAPISLMLLFHCMEAFLPGAFLYFFVHSGLISVGGLTDEQHGNAV